MKELIISNKGLSDKEFAAVFSRVQDYTNHCYRSENGNRIIVHCNPDPVFSVDAGRKVDGVSAAKLALRHYLKDYINEIELSSQHPCLDDRLAAAEQKVGTEQPEPKHQTIER